MNKSTQFKPEEIEALRDLDFVCLASPQLKEGDIELHIGQITGIHYDIRTREVLIDYYCEQGNIRGSGILNFHVFISEQEAKQNKLDSMLRHLDCKRGEVTNLEKQIKRLAEKHNLDTRYAV